MFVTSGAGGLFRPGVAVAVAIEINDDGAIAQLLSNPAASDVVMVEPIWHRPAVAALAAAEAGAPPPVAAEEEAEVAPASPTSGAPTGPSPSPAPSATPSAESTSPAAAD